MLVLDVEEEVVRPSRAVRREDDVTQPSSPMVDCIWMFPWNWLFGPYTLMFAPISVPAPLRAASS